jgi:8-oxo-dGTP pyrophosphatase MutT (NUDIX family)
MDEKPERVRDLDLVPAAVLVPIIDAPEPRLLLTVRHAGLRKHAGQIAFPGGRRDPEDESLIHTALREAEEEVGLPRDKVDVIGPTGQFWTGTGYEITPIIAVIPEGLTLIPHEAEVSGIFEVPLSHLFETANHVAHSTMYQGELMKYHEIQWQDYRIWGATAGMIVKLGRRLGPYL